MLTLKPLTGIMYRVNRSGTAMAALCRAAAPMLRRVPPTVCTPTIRLLASQSGANEGKSIVITGCDTGFGFSLAQHLHKKGFRVFAGCLLKDKDGEGSKKLEDMKSDRMVVIQLDVCKDEDVEKAVEFVKEHSMDSEKGLWGLINNAGISTFGEVEFTTMKTYKEVAEVNLWGTIRVTKGFLPYIRRAKDAQRALKLLENYRAKLAKTEDRQLRASIERVINIFRSNLFQALIDIQEFYEVSLLDNQPVPQKNSGIVPAVHNWDISSLPSTIVASESPPISLSPNAEDHSLLNEILDVLQTSVPTQVIHVTMEDRAGSDM